jgi:Domain of unknown function (DUF5658)
MQTGLNQSAAVKGRPRLRSSEMTSSCWFPGARDSMKIRFWCARCGQVYCTQRGLVGRRARCRVCGLVQRVPEPPAAPPEPSDYALAAVPPPPRPARTADRPKLTPIPKRKRRQYCAGRLLDFAEEASHLQGLSILLILLSMADLLMTFLLLQTSPRFYESNPVAQWIFQRWNIGGMAIFKFVNIGTAIVLGEYIERRRPGWGKSVLLVGCAAAAAVFWHGLRLYMGYGAMPVAEES